MAEIVDALLHLAGGCLVAAFGYWMGYRAAKRDLKREG